MLRSFVLACAISAGTLGHVATQSALAGATPCSMNFDYSVISGGFGAEVPATFTLVGSAADGGSIIYLTQNVGSQSGAVWYNAGRTWLTDGFDTTFSFQLQGEADGIAFVIQDAGLGALGGSGSDMGYAGIERSLAVEIDTFCFEDEFGCDHVSVQTNGVGGNSTGDSSSLGHASFPVDLNDGTPHLMRIVYVPGTLGIYFDGDTTPLLVIAVDLTDIMGDSIADASGCMIAGFTGSTGGATAIQTINGWEFSDFASEVPIGCNAGFNFDSFPSGGPFSLHGSAQVTENVLELTQDAEGQAGAAWYRLARLSPQKGFVTEFGFTLEGQADGFAFVMQGDSLNALGGGGSGLGYAGISNSLAVEIDTFCFSNEFDCDHVSVQLYGSSNDSASISHIVLPNDMNDGQMHIMRVEYEVGSLSVYVDGKGLITGMDISNFNITDNEGCLYVGFTGATGAVTARQFINYWNLQSNGPGCEPADFDYFNLGPETVFAGGAMVLEIGAIGTEPITYQWSRDGEPLEDGGNVSGAHSPILTINPTTTNDSGQYDILASNDCGGAATGMFKNVVPACPGDADHDGDVDFADITAVLTSFNFNYLPATGSGDANANGVVNFADITEVLTFFGTHCG